MISYIGGKSRIGKWIEPFIPNNIELYAEPFSGMMWEFFNMDLDKYPNLKTVVYNDFNGLNANLFKCSKDYDKLWNELKKYPCQELGVEFTPQEYKDIFKEFQKEIFNDNYIIGDEPNFDAAVKYTYVLTQIFSGAKPETSKYTDYKGKYKCKYLIFMDKLKNHDFVGCAKVMEANFLAQITLSRETINNRIVKMYDIALLFGAYGGKICGAGGGGCMLFYCGERKNYVWDMLKKTFPSISKIDFEFEYSDIKTALLLIFSPYNYPFAIHTVFTLA
jgi:site-specific DNA-adenine methylase